MQVGKRNDNAGHELSWIRGAVLVVAWLIIFSLAKDIWQIRIGFSRVSESEKRLADEEARHEFLLKKLENVQTPGYKEKQIREKLNMQKEGELVVVMPKRAEAVASNTLDKEETIQIWEKWLDLIQ